MQNLSRSQSSFSGQLHSGTPPLAIGRFISTPEEERFCLCDLGETEGEIHFVFHCPLYDEIRNLFVRRMLSICANFSWLDDHERLDDLCFRTGLVFLA